MFFLALTLSTLKSMGRAAAFFVEEDDEEEDEEQATRQLQPVGLQLAFAIVMMMVRFWNHGKGKPATNLPYIYRGQVTGRSFLVGGSEVTI